MPSEYEGVNHRLLTKKDAMFTYRPIDIANPYLYYLLVRQITTKGNWKEIKRVFSTFVSPNIDVISIPKVKGDKDKSHKAAGITDWWENIEQKNAYFESEIPLHVRYGYYQLLWFHLYSYDSMGIDGQRPSKTEKRKIRPAW